MGKYILRRLMMLIPTLLGMSILIFGMLRLLPGDILDIIAGTDAQVDPEQMEKLREAMGLADPIPVQYFKWMGNMLQGDPGNSMRSGEPVAELLARALPITLELAILSVIISTAIAVQGAAKFTARRKQTSQEGACRLTVRILSPVVRPSTVLLSEAWGPSPISSCDPSGPTPSSVRWI